MATFLFTTMPSNDLGLLTRSLPIGRELRARGHRVVCSNPARAPRRLIEEAGFENLLPDHPIFTFMGWPGLRSAVGALRGGPGRPAHRQLVALARALPLRRAPPADDVWGMDHAGAMLGMADAGFVRANVRGYLAHIEALAPDAVVDFWNPMAVLAARAAGRPVATVIQADAHPSSRGFVWWKAPPAPPPTCLPAVNRVAAELGLPPVSRLEELSVGALTIAVGSPETDPLPPGAGVEYVGTILWERAGAALPAWLDGLGRERPLVWVYSGNPRYRVSGDTLDSEVVLEATIEALAGEDLDVVLTTSHHALPARLARLPARFHHAAFLPGLAMARRADVLVHHGGYGSCQAGLEAGKPAVVVPTFSERESNARRLEALGAAVRVEVTRSGGRKAVSPGVLRDAVRRALTEPAIGRRARDLGDRLRGLGGAPRAAALIEGLLAPRGGGRTVVRSPALA
ncbi:MAG: hypothetical protein U0229_24420 [Anaeromyxobacter sp.]